MEKITMMRPAAVALLLVAWLAPAASASQDQDVDESSSAAPSSEREAPRATGFSWGHIEIRTEDWVAQPNGLQYEPVSRINPLDPLDTQLIPLEHGTDDSFRYQLNLELKNNLGELMLTYWGHRDEVARGFFSPGQFVFGEVLAHPLHAGIFDDGLADGVLSNAQTVTRDFRLDFRRLAFRAPRIEGKWFAGIRRVSHHRTIRADYFALAPNLPPLIPPVSSPRPDLDPVPDRVLLSSEFNGRGVEGGMDLRFPLLRRRLWLETGLALGVLRGEVDTVYQSTTAFYAVIRAGEIAEILEPPYDNLDDPDPQNPQAPLADSVQQIFLPVGLRSVNDPQTSLVAEAYLGLRWRAWRGLEVLLGFRDTGYSDVGVDLRPEQAALAPNGAANFQSVGRTQRSATYEGFYLGLSYRH